MAKPFAEWYPGPWRVTAEDALTQRVRLQPGDLMRHRTGAVILNCPACNAMQVGRVDVTGPADAPSLSAPVHCGKGFCSRCGVWFTVVAGRTREAEQPAVRPTRIPDKLRAAGVTHPPSLEAAVRAVQQRRG